MELKRRKTPKYLDGLGYEWEAGAARESLRNYVSMANFLIIYIKRSGKKRSEIPGVFLALRFCVKKIREFRKRIPESMAVKAYSDRRLKSVKESLGKLLRRKRARRFVPVSTFKLVCSYCGCVNPRDARFCVGCGRSIEQGL
ncbi:MAG: hypothetical protein ACFFBS_04735 [Promethearchaeota archaeon]